MNNSEYMENAPWNVDLEEETAEMQTEAEVTEETAGEGATGAGPAEQEGEEMPTAREDGVTELSRNEIAEFTRRLSGKDMDGNSKVVIGYQTYAMEEPEDSVDKTRVYNTDKPSIELSFDPTNPQFYVLDIAFRSYDDPELKMLWGRLQRFKRNQAMDGEKTWIFYFNILERASVTEQTLERDTLLIANVFNPTLFYLTREVPNILATDTSGDDGALHGGNVIRMLVPVELITFQITDEIDTSLIKGEVLRENEAREYLDNAEDNSNIWEE